MEVKRDEMIVTMVKGRRGYKCCACGMLIEPGEMHYTIVQGGGGLGWLKFPDRCHLECVDNYLGRRSKT